MKCHFFVFEGVALFYLTQQSWIVIFFWGHADCTSAPRRPFLHPEKKNRDIPLPPLVHFRLAIASR